MVGGEGQQICPLGRKEGSWLAEPMTGRHLDPREDRLITGLGMLQAAMLP
jgi:hypothetical protein